MAHWDLEYAYGNVVYVSSGYSVWLAHGDAVHGSWDAVHGSSGYRALLMRMQCMVYGDTHHGSWDVVHGYAVHDPCGCSA